MEADDGSQASQRSLTRLTAHLIFAVNLAKGGNNSVVECNLAKVEVAGSNPVSRSIFLGGIAKW